MDPSLNKISGRLMGFVSKKWRRVPEDQVETIICRDMATRVRRVMRGLDAYDLGEVPHYKPQTVLDRLFLKFGRHMVRMIHASTFLNRSEITKLLLPLIIFAPLKQVAIAGTAAGKLVGHFLDKANINFGSKDPENLIAEFWPENVGRRNIPNQYERLDPKKLTTIRWLDAEEAGIKPDKENLHKHLPVDWPAAYIWGVFNGPPGVETSHFRIGQQSVLLAKQPNGLILEYWPQSGTVFARKTDSLRIEHDGIDFDRIRPLPSDVKRLLDHNDMVMVTRNKKLERLSVRPVSGKEYTRIIRNLRRRKVHDPLAPKFNMKVVKTDPKTRPALRLKPVSTCPLTRVVDKWEAEEVPVPTKRQALLGGLIGEVTDSKTTGGALEEGVTEVGEGVLTSAVRVALRPRG